MAPRALLCVALVALILGNPAEARISSKRLMELSEKALYLISMQDTVLAIKARANSIRAYNHMKQGEKEEAQMSMYRAMFGLAVVNGAGGLVVQNPMTIAFVNQMKKRSEFKAAMAAWNKYNNVIQDDIYRGLITQDEFLTKAKTDEVVKTLRRASKWAKVVKYIDFLGPWFDGISLVLDSWDLYDAIKENNTPGIVSASLGIASSLVGLATLGAVALGFLTGGVAIFALGALSACLGLAGTLVEIAYQEPCCHLEVKIDPLAQLREAGMDELEHSRKYLERFPEVFKRHEFYESNPANMQVREAVQAGGEPLRMTRGWYYDLNHDRGTYIKTGGLREDDFQGYVLVKEPYSGRGAMVVLDTKLVRDSRYKLRGANIQTYADRDIDVKDADFVSIGDFWELEAGEKLIVKTGHGNDTIHINGPIGQPTSDFGEDTLDVDTGARHPFPETLNTLSFSNLAKGRQYFIKEGYLYKLHHIKGAYYSARTAQVVLWYKPDSLDLPVTLHKFGKIKPINLVIGSSYNDVIEMSGAAFYVEQTEGINKYIMQAVTAAYYEFYEIVDSSESYRLSGQQPELVVCSSERITINNFEWTDEQILNFRVSSYFKTVMRSIRFQFLTEPKVSIYYSRDFDSCVDNLKSAPEKTFDLTLAKQSRRAEDKEKRGIPLSNIIHSKFFRRKRGSSNEYVQSDVWPCGSERRWRPCRTKSYDYRLCKSDEEEVDISNNVDTVAFNFKNVGYGSWHDDTMRFLKPDASSAGQNGLLVNLHAGNDTVILTNDLMRTIIDSGAAMELKEEGGKDWMQIRQGNSIPDGYYYFNYIVELVDVEMIMNEEKRVLVDLRKPVEGTIDLKARYEMAMP
ncbi:predicted protein [Nematostella vectensis]|uniref:Uncharacterized protein n=1 Tax=Nematostella vectensis TaxID=45351 RepID=A7RT03_NEMVE|nr:predicted protein [Nematostella vectensis]|eukprot:XP_001637427.1 predicted protein [Nematostella vectensis]